MSEELEADHISQELEQLDDRSEQLFQKGHLRSALRIAKETTRLSKSHQRVVHHMRGLFDQMRFGHGLLEPQTTANAAVELIAILNDEEHARKIEPNLDEGHYHWVCQWMTSCAYDNLAEATGDMHGYNSTGMHECISDGIQVCRQTGKMECIKCFREYATDVYLAADDLEMVAYQCQALLEYRGKEIDRKDRRWSGHRKQAWLHVLSGELGKALESLGLAQELSQAEDVYLKDQAQLQVCAALDEALMLSGAPRFDWSTIPAEKIPAPGEWLAFELDRAKGTALSLVLDKDLDGAIKLLTEWDQRLTQLQCLKDWFEVRLRLIAAYLLADKRTRGESLARGLEAKAAESQDFLTLHRLKRLLDPAETVVPVPTLKPVDRGPFAHITPVALTITETPTSAASENSDETSAEPPAPVEKPEEVTPLKEPIEALMAQILDSRQNLEEEALEKKLAELFEQILAYVPESVEHPRDGATLLHICRWVITSSEAARRVWNYGLAMVQRFPQDATTLNVCADLGAHFRNVDAETFEDVSDDDVERMFRKSLGLNTELPRNYLRAGDYFEQRGNIGEAERCFARAFRLDRKEGTAAISLANIYRQTDRNRDALAALDLSLREGSENADVAWEAALAAYGLEQFDSQLTYLERHLELTEPHLWVEYYRAWALLELKRYDECLAALSAEEELQPPGVLHLRILKACALAGQGEREAAASVIHEVLGILLAEVDYLSMNGILRNFGRLGQAVADWPADNPARQALMLRLMETGLMPDAYFEELRGVKEPVEGVNFYRVRLRQPVGQDWSQHPGCLPGQQQWKYYFLEWGVLAKTEEEAGFQALQMHHSGLPEPAEVLQVEMAGEDYTDRPGVVWQGHRWTEETDDETEQAFEDSGEEE